MTDAQVHKANADGKIIFVVNGYPESGKTEFEKIASKYKPTMIHSSIDCVKEIAIEYFGWDGDESNKTEELRLLLSNLKKMLVSKFDYVMSDISKAVDKFHNSDDLLLMIDSREPEEIERFKNEFGAITIFIKRENCNMVKSNPSDANVENYKYDYYVDNNGSLDDLRSVSHEIIDCIIKKKGGVLGEV